MRVAVIDDWQEVAQGCADWNRLEGRARVTFFAEPFTNEAAAATALAGFEVIVPMRERTKFTRSLLERLTDLRLLALTGYGTRHIDTAYCAERGIVCCGSGAYSPAGTAEYALALLLAAARHVPQADAAMRAGRFQQQIPLGKVLEGKVLGVLGLGRIGARVAAFGQALGMKVIAWSSNLTAERTAELGVEYVAKHELFARADAVTLHLVLSPRSQGIVGATEIAAMKPGAILVNTSRGPLIDEAALLSALREGRITAALDVYDQEPLPAGHELRRLGHVVLSPHLGFCTSEGFEVFYGESLENIFGWLSGTPLRVIALTP